jgi:hypothetical protein
LLVSIAQPPSCADAHAVPARVATAAQISLVRVIVPTIVTTVARRGAATHATVFSNGLPDRQDGVMARDSGAPVAAN